MGNTEMIVNALRDREPYVEFQTISIIGSVDAEIQKAYNKDPKLCNCIKNWSGNKMSGQGVFGVKTSYRITLEYVDDLPPYDQIMLDDGSWVPSADFKKNGWKETVWIVTSDEEGLKKRVNDDWDELQEMQPTYQGVEASYYSTKKSNMMLYILQFKTVVGGNQAVQYTSLAERQADMVVSRFFGGRNVFAFPPIVRAYMAFSYIQQNCEFDDLADSTKENDQPENPWTHVAFGPLCKGVGIAMGIADAYRVLLGKMGISCKLVHGEARDEDTAVVHTWCVINIGSEWFFSDPTFGVNGPNVDVTRFIFNGQKARNDYVWEESRVPSCYSLRPNYTDVSNYVDAHLGQMIANGVEERYISDDYVD